jgi:hypothetical protein
MRCAGAAFVLLIGTVVLAGATEFHISSTAGSNGNGSRSNPWLINAGLQSTIVQPGDTITLDGGTYVNPTNGQDQVAFKCTVHGSSSRPVIVRAAPGQHVALDGANSLQNDILRISGSYVWVWGLEVYSSSPNRYSATGGSSPLVSEIQRGYCVEVDQGTSPVGVKVINCIIHDGFGGFDAWASAGTELYGSILYNNGWLASDRNHGHNVYIQNHLGSQRATNSNIIWGAFDNNIQAYGTQNTDDFSFDRNIVFEGIEGGFLVGGGALAHNAQITNNYLYSSTDAEPVADWGWHGSGAGLTNATITGNYVGGMELYMYKIVNSNVSGNTFYTTYHEGYSPADFPDNTWLTTKPTATKIVVIPNMYEAGRANIAVYNWSHSSSVQVDLSGVLGIGDQYKIIDAQNPSVIVASGSYSGPTSIAMNGLAAAQPVGPGSGPGQATRTHTAPEFGAFIVSTSNPSVTPHARVRVFLQGPYNTGTNAMKNSLRTGGQLAAHFGSLPIPAGAVDSINIEIRNTATSPTLRAFAPAWLLTDGTIRNFLDTTKDYVGFPGVPPGDYYVVVSHRNHLAIMSSARSSVDGTVAPPVYDFSTGQGQAYGTNPMIAAGTRFAMYAGDVSGGGILYNGPGNDRALIYVAIGGGNITLTVNGYLNTDVNLDGTVMYNGAGNDRAIIYSNIGGGSIIATVQTQVP